MSWAALLPMSMLYATFLLPSRSFLESWPYGLVAVLAVSHVCYIIFWVCGVNGVDYSLARNTLLFIIAVGTWGPLTRRSGAGLVLRTQPTVVSLISVGSVLTLYVVAFVSPDVLINAHLGGGDHSNHVGFAYSLISHVHRAPMPNPITLTDYVHATHFLIALVSASSIKTFDGTMVGLIFRDFSVFDVMAVIGVLQVAASCVFRTRPKPVSQGLLVVVPAVVLFRFPNLIAHFWLSGFSTSLVALLVLSGVIGSQFSLRDRSDRTRVHIVSTVVLLGVYQPLALVPFAALIVERVLPVRTRCRQRAWVIVGLSVAPMLGVLGVGTIDGRRGEIVQTLLRPGESLRPSITVYWLLIGAILVIGIAIERALLPAAMVLVVSSITNGFWLLSRRFGAVGEPVYYVRKLLWTGIAMAIIVLSVAAILCVSHLVRDVSTKRRVLLSGSVIGLSIFVLGTNPVPRFTFIEGKWFVDQLLDSKTNISTTAVALNPADLFTSHLANVALTMRSDIAHEFDLALLRGLTPAQLCEVSRRIGASQVFTSRSEIENLRDLGCGTDGQELVTSRG